MPIHRYLREAAFEQRDIDRMVAAYEAALKLLHLKDRNDPVCELVAKKIIEVARGSDNEPSQICARAVTELGIPPMK